MYRRRWLEYAEVSVAPNQDDYSSFRDFRNSLCLNLSVTRAGCDQFGQDRFDRYSFPSRSNRLTTHFVMFKSLRQFAIQTGILLGSSGGVLQQALLVPFPTPFLSFRTRA